jgi:hypothetical protein
MARVGEECAPVPAPRYATLNVRAHHGADFDRHAHRSQQCSGSVALRVKHGFLLADKLRFRNDIVRIAPRLRLRCSLSCCTV